MVPLRCPGYPVSGQTGNREELRFFDGNPVFLVRASPCTPRIRYRTRLEIRRFLSEMRRSTHKLARQDYALFSTIVYTGLRLSEATRALWGDVGLRRRQLLVRLAKGGRQESRHIPGRLLHATRMSKIVGLPKR